MSWKKLQLKSFKIFLLKPKKYIITQQDTPHHTTLFNHQQFNTRQYGLYSVRNQARITWNEMQNKLTSEPPTKVKRALRKYFSNIYHIPIL